MAGNFKELIVIRQECIADNGSICRRLDNNEIIEKENLEILASFTMITTLIPSSPEFVENPPEHANALLLGNPTKGKYEGQMADYYPASYCRIKR